MKWQPIPVVGGAYADESRPFAFQDCINWLPVRAERPNTREAWKLTPVPGLSVFAAFENASTDTTDRVRGLRNVEGRLYVVCGQSLFRVNTNGTIETVQENAIPGTGRVTMTHNQEEGGYSLVLTNGFGGWTYNSGTGTFAEIDDDGFPGFKTCDFVDQYIVGISPDGLFAFHSDLANAGEYNTLDRYTAEAAPDRLVGQIVDHGQWWLCGERTIEIYTNTGVSTNTFQRIPGSTIERGLAGTHAIAKLDNSVFWVGDDGVVYRANGFTPVRISTHPIERELSQCDLSRAFCLVYEDRGHKILYVTCPDGKTWGYDVATQEWHRRESYNRSNWRVTCLARWAGGWLGGDELTNRLQRVDWAYNAEDGTPLVVRRTTGILHANENRVQVHAFRLTVDSGRIPGQARPLEERTYPVEIYNPLAEAYVASAVNHNYLGRFGVTPYTFAVVAGTLPTGLSLASNGNLTGTPTTAGAFAWRVRITDAIGQTDTLDQGIDLAAGIDGGAVFEVGSHSYLALLHFNGNNTDEIVTNTWSGGVSASSPVKFGSGSVRINGHSSNVITTTKFETLIGTGPFTIDCWIYRDSNAPGHSNDIILGHWYAAPDRSLNWAIPRSTNIAAFAMSSNGTDFTQVNSTVTIPYDEWVHMRVTRDETNTVRQFVNGAISGSATFAGALHENVSLGTNWIIGGNDSTFGVDPVQGFQGWIDEFVMMSACLSTSAFTPPTTPWPNP